MSQGREKSTSLTSDQKSTLVDLINQFSVVLDKSGNYSMIAKKQEAWETITKKFNAVHPFAEKKTSLQLKRAWGYLRNKVKVEYASYTKKKFATGGGPPPSPPKLSPLLEATANLISEELELAEFQYDSSCRDVPLPTNPLPEAPKSPSPQPLHPSSPLLVLHEEDYDF
ncbi:uncharacterized protein LOC123514676 [Portunus trituberculatus]|uniref:uncharacterized protein LOC123514676 n=1 Tax=Portunus trituberculatus TaxID=210409 RepID=UPI001E1CC9A9|nr:uncharacterized protein LOC123514676 [Portunus trituberculatus]